MSDTEDTLVEQLREAAVELTTAQDERTALHEEWLTVRAEWAVKLKAADAKVERAHDALAVLVEGGQRPPSLDVGEQLRRSRMSVRVQIIAWFRSHPNTIFDSRDVARALGCRRDTARSRLHELVHDGILRRVADGQFQLRNLT